MTAGSTQSEEDHELQAKAPEQPLEILCPEICNLLLMDDKLDEMQTNFNFTIYSSWKNMTSTKRLL